MPQTAQLRQRSEYTHRFNSGAGRHGWLRLTPAYSRKIVDDILAAYPTTRRVFDPFCGTGTTALSAAIRGHDAVTTDINPFLIWFTRAKTAHYGADAADSARTAASAAVRLAADAAIEPWELPPIHNISRWWDEDDLGFLARLKAALAKLAPKGLPASDLLQVAFCRLIVRLSHAAFNHQSMSFRATAPQLLSPQPGRTYLQEVEAVSRSALENPQGTVQVEQADARSVERSRIGVADLVITSPPYANRMSYVRELRPYMYWLDYFQNARDAGELDWLAVGGTWGIATSRLTGWQTGGHPVRPELAPVLRSIRTSDRPNATILAKYVARYFEDMTEHFQSVRTVLRPGARVHYVVGNSVFYQTVTPTERIYAGILRECGFEDVRVRPLRKRNSKRELVEFEVSATWP